MRGSMPPDPAFPWQGHISGWRRSTLAPRSDLARHSEAATRPRGGPQNSRRLPVADVVRMSSTRTRPGGVAQPTTNARRRFRRRHPVETMWAGMRTRTRMAATADVGKGNARAAEPPGCSRVPASAAGPNRHQGTRAEEVARRNGKAHGRPPPAERHRAAPPYFSSPSRDAAAPSRRSRDGQLQRLAKTIRDRLPGICRPGRGTKDARQPPHSSSQYVPHPPPAGGRTVRRPSQHVAPPRTGRLARHYSARRMRARPGLRPDRAGSARRSQAIAPDAGARHHAPGRRSGTVRVTRRPAARKTRSIGRHEAYRCRGARQRRPSPGASRGQMQPKCVGRRPATRQRPPTWAPSGCRPDIGPSDACPSPRQRSRVVGPLAGS